MNKKLSYLKSFALTFILLTIILTGCIEEIQRLEEKKKLTLKTEFYQTSILPEWKDGFYHDNYETKELINDFNKKFPDLVLIFSIGKSVLNRDIWCIRITNENNNSHKYSCLYDGCIHGNEWEGGEACLYFAEYLLINYGKNKTISGLLNKSEIYIIPIVNPDGRQNDERFNNNGIDLNRNFDVHFGRFLGGSMRFGKWFPFKWIRLPFPPYMLTKSGRYPFSEPESIALRDMMEELRFNDFSFYLTCHTATHCFSRPSNKIKRQEYEISNQELKVLDYAKSWVEKNTEYKSADDDNYIHGAGYSATYCFKEFHIPSFGFEILNSDYEPMFGHGPHDHLIHWMKTTLPVFMYLLVNIENLHNWQIPNLEPILPDGVPPELLS